MYKTHFESSEHLLIPKQIYELDKFVSEKITELKNSGTTPSVTSLRRFFQSGGGSRTIKRKNNRRFSKRTTPKRNKIRRKSQKRKNLRRKSQKRKNLRRNCTFRFSSKKFYDT